MKFGQKNPKIDELLVLRQLLTAEEENRWLKLSDLHLDELTQLAKRTVANWPKDRGRFP